MTGRPVTVRPAAHGLELVVDRRVPVPRLRGWGIFTLAVVLAFFVLIFSRVALDRAAFDLVDLEHQIATEQTKYWELRLEVARLESPGRIVEAAEGLGLVYPEEVRRLVVERPAPPQAVTDDRWARLKSMLSAQP